MPVPAKGSPLLIRADLRDNAAEQGIGMRSILVPVEDHDRMEGVLETALVFARRFESYVEGIPLGPDIAEMVAADFSMSGVIFDDRTRREFLRNAAETFEGFMTRRAVPRRSDTTQGPSFGWMIEEMRISLFAQELRTSMPMSVQRLAAKRDELLDDDE